MPRQWLSTVLGVIGAALGGFIGYWICAWVVGQALYPLVVPGALVGLGCSLFARHHSVARGAACGIAGTVLGFYTDWSLFPFATDGSLKYFVTHLHHLTPITLIMIAAGGLIAYWTGKDYTIRGGRAPKPTVQEPSTSD